MNDHCYGHCSLIVTTDAHLVMKKLPTEMDIETVKPMVFL